MLYFRIVSIICKVNFGGYLRSPRDRHGNDCGKFCELPKGRP